VGREEKWVLFSFWCVEAKENYPSQFLIIYKSWLAFLFVQSQTLERCCYMQSRNFTNLILWLMQWCFQTQLFHGQIQKWQQTWRLVSKRQWAAPSYG
jgi:hypothetical protein